MKDSKKSLKGVWAKGDGVRGVELSSTPYLAQRVCGSTAIKLQFYALIITPYLVCPSTKQLLNFTICPKRPLSVLGDWSNTTTHMVILGNDNHVLDKAGNYSIKECPYELPF